MATVTKRVNAYQIVVTKGYDVRGKRIRQTETWKIPDGLSEKKIQKALDEEVRRFEYECRNLRTAPRIKFEEYLETVYMPERDPETGIDPVKRKTFDTYKGYTKRLNAFFGHMWLDKIARDDVKVFVQNLTTEKLQNNREGCICAKGVKNHYSFLTSVFKNALENGYITDNPCNNIRLPRAKKEEVEIYSTEEAAHILELLKIEPGMFHHYVYKVLEIYTGFRRGEICGLEWSDIDFEKNVLTIRRTSYYSQSYGTFTDTPKSQAGFRSVSLPDEVVGILAEFYRQRQEYIASVGTYWNGTERLFATSDGKPICPNTPYKYFTVFCQRNGIPHLKPHSFRHLAASILLNDGIDVKTVSHILGHSTASTTLNTYAHIINKHGAALRASNSISEAIGANLA
ncbi:MAG: site-specific integrase [Ruminococcus sp.]|jgi:integrase|nr:site-specific integrase [Ruminococcus sp.]